MKATALALAALMAMAPAAVFAQANVDAATKIEAPAVNAAANIGANADFDAFLQGFGGADYTSATAGIDTATTFNVVKLSTLANADATKLKDATSPHEADIAALTARIEANAAAKAALEAQGLTAARVVWIATGADGAVTLYVNDLPAM